MPGRLIITVGGTGGHIYPAIALADSLEREIPDLEILFVGGKLASNKYFAQHSHRYEEVSCSPSLKRFDKIGQGTWQSWKLFQNFCPQAVVGFGSYYTLPPLLAAKLCRIPMILHEANAYPGKINRLFSRFSACTGVHFTETLTLIKGPAETVGMPLRRELVPKMTSRGESYNYFKLNPKKKTVLIFGGSQGAEAISRAASAAIPDDCQVVHLTGTTTEDYSAQYQRRGIPACVKAFETEMAAAWEIADVVVCRSGASTIAELSTYAVPAILIPFPRAADNHQELNADIAVGRGQAVKILEEELGREVMAAAVDKQLSDVVEPPPKPEKSLADLVKPYLIQEQRC